MSRTGSRATMLAALLLLVVACGGTASRAGSSDATPSSASDRFPVTVTDAGGARVTISEASRIASLNGSVTEIVYALGLGDRLVGVDTSSRYPEQAQRLPTFGYQRDLSAEGILAAAPTVIVGTTDAGPPPVIGQLRSTGTPVMIVENPPDLGAATEKITSIGAALGVPDRAEQLSKQTRHEIEQAVQIAGKAATRPRVMFLYVRGQGTQLIAGADTTAHAMITAAGAVNAGAELGITGYRPLTPEALTAARPEVLLLLSHGLESVGGVDGLRKIPGVGETPAAKADRILAYEDLYLLGMGPRTGQALRELALGLHPELAP